MPGHARADRGERAAGELPDETQHPFAHLTEQGRGNSHIALCRVTCHRRGHPQQLGVHQRLGRRRHRICCREQRRDSDEGAGPAVADGHRPTIGSADEDPDHPGDDQLQKWGRLTLPVRHRPRRNPYPAGAYHEFVENIARKVTQVRPRQRQAQPSIHSRILTEAWISTMGLWDIARWARRDGLIIRLIIQTILLDPSRSDQISPPCQPAHPAWIRSRPPTASPGSADPHPPADTAHLANLPRRLNLAVQLPAPRLATIEASAEILPPPAGLLAGASWCGRPVRPSAPGPYGETRRVSSAPSRGERRRG